MPNIPSWQTYLDLMEKESHNFKIYEHRADKLFFRGAPTGNRALLLADVPANNTKIDVVLQHYTEHRKDEEHVSLPQHCDYRYLLHLPGHGYSVRLKYLLLCASTVVFYDNGIDEFWYHLLEDRKHVYKVQAGDVATDFQKLYSVVLHSEANAQEAKLIGANGRRLVKDLLTVENVQRYFAHILWEYASLQKFKPKVHRDAVLFRDSVMGPDAHFTVHTRDCSFCKADVANIRELQ